MKGRQGPERREDTAHPVVATCRKVHPGRLRFETGDLVRCEEPKGHTGDHFHSFAMRSWA